MGQLNGSILVTLKATLAKDTSAFNFTEKHESSKPRYHVGEDLHYTNEGRFVPKKIQRREFEVGRNEADLITTNMKNVHTPTRYALSS